jgi:hypothetical protein
MSIFETFFGRSDNKVSEAIISAVWEGTPLLATFQFARITAQGKDKVWLLGSAHEAFDMAHEARKQAQWHAVEQALCLCLSYHLIANSQADACTALGNLAMTYEKIGNYTIALRLQQYALAMKRQFAPSPEGIGRSLWLIGRAQAGLGDFDGARESMQASIVEFRRLGKPNPQTDRDLSWVEQQIASGKASGAIPPDQD